MADNYKILVTGGAGYIGSHTIVALLEAGGFDIISADNYSNSTPQTYDRIRKITGKDVTVVEADLSDAVQTENLFTAHPGIQGVIHFAAYKSVPESVQHPELYYRNNINSLLNIIESGKKHGLKHLLFSSSCSVYGNISTLPVNENTPLGKTESPYAYTKVIGEKIVQDCIQAHSALSGISLRYFNPVGAHPTGWLGELPNQRPNNLVPMITQTAIGKHKEMSVFGDDYPTRDGTCIRDYIHVCDIAEAHVTAINQLRQGKQKERYCLYNLGSGEGVSVLEAIHTFEKVSGQKLNYRIAPRRDGDVIAIYSDSAKANKELGWTTKFDLKSMMESAWKWELHLAGKL